LVQNFENKLVLITGASRGIGKSIALALAKDGAHVICAATEARNSGKVVTEIQAAGGKATAIGCLVENPLAVKRMFAEVLDQAGPVDVLINNAGISKPMLTMEMTEENWDQHMNVLKLLRSK
jgi:3-oxoacyl-[acyl-carrier protein] reductase